MNGRQLTASIPSPLKLNHERYAEQVAQGLHDKNRKGKRRGRGQRTGKKATAAEESSGTLF